MTDVTIKRFDELPGDYGQFFYAAAGLGVSAWGMNLLTLPPSWADYPDHDHLEDGQEEVYLVIEGSATLIAGEERWELGPKMFARVGPAQKRKLVPGPDGVTLLAIGGTPGKAYERPSWMRDDVGG